MNAISRRRSSDIWAISRGYPVKNANSGAPSSRIASARLSARDKGRYRVQIHAICFHRWRFQRGLASASQDIGHAVPGAYGAADPPSIREGARETATICRRSTCDRSSISPAECTSGSESSCPAGVVAERNFENSRFRNAAARGRAHARRAETALVAARVSLCVSLPREGVAAISVPELGSPLPPESD